MDETLEFLARTLLVGAGATAVMDAWTLFIKRCFGTVPLDYAMVGRWIGHLPRGRFVHQAIARAAPVRGERAIGWGAHYAIGIAFAAMLLAIAGLEWARRPTVALPLVFGVLTVAAPFFVLQPALGAGIAASRTPRPGAARLRSLMTHASFGLGLALSAWLQSLVLRA
ncbi:DUF2938 domain-containing protein [Ramlibacter sp.]|uniref:DUF2938 domain-containing protein n=1 Tax=Ramlibacter sp. TaxID=1917967 RepID=UPI0017C1093C|nr:DUF2938 domain-containing protein [Ramlibacter sp.]MBA2675683.1 DUF2938 domain-containing protein [Ramlibacter sp.]